MWIAVGVAVAAAVAAGVGMQAAGPPSGGGVTAADASAAAGVGGPFRMTDQEGRPVDQSILKGKWSLVFFGYTACPDVCPATLQTLAAAQDRLGAQAARTQIVFISVDPDRDTPAAMKSYLASAGFPKGVVGLTGTPGQVADTARAYHAFYRKRPTGGGGPKGGYDMDHSAFIYLMDPAGRFRLPTLAEQQGPDAIAKTVGDAIRAG